MKVTIKVQQGVSSQDGNIDRFYGIHTIQKLLYTADITILSCKEYDVCYFSKYKLKLKLTKEQIPDLKAFLRFITEHRAYTVLKGI